MSATHCRLGSSLVLGTLMLVSGLYLCAGQPDAPPVDKAGQAADDEAFVPPANLFQMPIDEQVVSLAFSPDGKRLVTAGAWWQQPGQLKIWNVPDAQELVVARGFSGVRSIAWSPDGSTLATGDFSGTVRLRDAGTGAEKAAVKGHKSGINSVAFSFDGKMLVSAGLDRVIHLWDAASLQLQKDFAGHDDMVLSVAFFRDGATFVSTSKDRTARIWDIASGKEKHILRGHQHWIETAAISPDDKTVATGSLDQTVRLWDAVSGAEKGKLVGHTGGVLALAFSPDGKWLASAGYDMTVRVWDVASQKPLATLGKHRGAIWTLAFSRDGLLASGGDTTAKLWNVAEKKEIAFMQASDHRPIQALAYSPDGKLVAVAKEDAAVQLCDAKTGDLVHVLRGHAGIVTCLAFSSAGDVLVSGSADRTVKVWDPRSGRIYNTLTGHPSGVTALAFTPDGKMLSVGREDGHLERWNVQSAKVDEKLKADVGPIFALAYAPDGRLAVGGDTPIVKVLDPAKNEVVDSLPGHAGPVRALAFSRDGVLASAGDDGTVKIWDKAKERLALKGHDGSVLALAFSPTGRRLVSGGADGTVRIWDPRNGQAHGLFDRHAAPVAALAMHPAGADVLSGSKDTQILRWPRAVTNIPPLPVIFRHDFRGTKINNDFLKLTSKKPPNWFVQEAEGLRISPPLNVPRNPPSGVMTTFSLQGDFDVIASYEILQAKITGLGGPIGVNVYITTDTQTQDAVMLSRFNRKDGMYYTCSGKMTTPIGMTRVSPKSRDVPSDVMSGQLRLVRQGPIVRFLVAEEGAEGFQELHRVHLGEEDTRVVRFAVDAGNKDSPPVVGRLRTFEVRGQAGTLPVAPPIAVAVAKSPEKKPLPKKDYAQEYHQSFKERLEKIPGWRLMKPESEQEVLAGPEGLRITMPLGLEGRRSGIGLTTDFGVKGDFEATLRYEILQEPEPRDTGDGGTGLTLRVDLENPPGNYASLTRSVRPTEGTRFTSYQWNAGKDHLKKFPANTKKGQLRLVRTGAMLACYVAEDPSEEFNFLYALPFGDADLKRICVLGNTGGPKTSLDVYVTDFRIRADAMPGLPTSAAPAVLAETSFPATWIVGVLVVLAGVFLMASALVAWLVFRRPRQPATLTTVKKKPAKPAPVTSNAPVSSAAKNKPTERESAVPPLVFRCSDCGRTLKVKPELAGKKVKCAQCGSAVPVPHREE